MLNKIWAGLIIIGLLFAVGQDIQDEISNTYKNGVIHQIPYSNIENSSNQLSLTFNNATLIATIKSDQKIHIHLDTDSPAYLQNIADANGNKNRLIGHINSKNNTQLNLLLPELHWNKLRKVTQAAFDMAKFAVKLAIGLIGIMALWLGLMQIAEKSGLIKHVVKIVQPLLFWLFPKIPKDHPVFGSISMNMAANILGLGNAATPLGIKAMQQLQSLNTNKDKASDEMCMFLALNTSSVQLLPPVTLIALMGTQVSELIVPIILATSCSTITAILVAKLYSRHNARQDKTCSN
ncbi:MAG: nucleoside recognition protein [Gammaproteobacteria bacterium]|nr:nucleoside recognition protein [Gammaproteobacteria bacterium]